MFISFSHMGQIQDYYRKSQDILERYYIESVKTELSLSEQSRIPEFVKDQANSQDIERLHAKLMIYYTIFQNIESCIEVLEKGKNESEVEDGEKWRVYARIESTMSISQIFKKENDVYAKEAELESKNGLGVLRNIEVKVSKLTSILSQIVSTPNKSYENFIS